MQIPCRYFQTIAAISSAARLFSEDNPGIIRFIAFSSSLHFSQPNASTIHQFSDRYHFFIFLPHSFPLWIILPYYFYPIHTTNISAMPFFHYLTITIKHKRNNLLVCGAPLGSTKWLQVLGKLGHSKVSQKSCLISPFSSGVICSQKYSETSLKMKLQYWEAVKWKPVLLPGWRRCPKIKWFYASDV